MKIKSLKLKIRRFMVVSLTALSLGSSLTIYGDGEDKLDKKENNKYSGIYLNIGLAVNNSRYNDLCNEMGGLEELDLDKEKLIIIFDKYFMPIIDRDTKIVQEGGKVDEVKQVLEKLLFHYIDFHTENYFMNLLWNVSFIINLNEGAQGIERMKKDFKNWSTQEIAVKSLIEHFLIRFKCKDEVE